VFLTKDRMGFAAGDLQLYRYAGNGFTNGSDPSGNAIIFDSHKTMGEWNKYFKESGDGLNGEWYTGELDSGRGIMWFPRNQDFNFLKSLGWNDAWISTISKSAIAGVGNNILISGPPNGDHAYSHPQYLQKTYFGESEREQADHWVIDWTRMAIAAEANKKPPEIRPATLSESADREWKESNGKTLTRDNAYGLVESFFKPPVRMVGAGIDAGRKVYDPSAKADYNPHWRAYDSGLINGEELTKRLAVDGFSTAVTLGPPVVKAMMPARTTAPLLTRGPFSSLDKHVGETANKLERVFPGRVEAVNKPVPATVESGSREVDIIMDEFIIQVKSKRASRLAPQVQATQETLIDKTKTVIGYAPDNYSPAAWKGAAEAGTPIARNFDELIRILKELSSK